MVMIQPAIDVPPDYYTVCRMEEGQLPSYLQAVERDRENIIKWYSPSCKADNENQFLYSQWINESVCCEVVECDIRI